VATDSRIACSLSSSDAKSRQGEWNALLQRGALRRLAVPGGMRIELRSDDDVRADLIRLVGLERECCPFLDLTIDDAGGELALTVTAPPEAQPVVEELLS
jgi:MerR family transcriptional regulator, copper efflux regulator